MGDKGKASLVGALVRAVCSAWPELAQNEAVNKLCSAVRYRMGAIPGSATSKPANLIYGVRRRRPPFTNSAYGAILGVAWGRRLW